MAWLVPIDDADRVALLAELPGRGQSGDAGAEHTDVHGNSPKMLWTPHCRGRTSSWHMPFERGPMRSGNGRGQTLPCVRPPGLLVHHPTGCGFSSWAESVFPPLRTPISDLAG